MIDQGLHGPVQNLDIDWSEFDTSYSNGDNYSSLEQQCEAMMQVPL